VSPAVSACCCSTAALLKPDVMPVTLKVFTPLT